MSKHFAFGTAQETAWTEGFSIVLSLLSEYIEAERDLEDINQSCDPALSLWMRDRDIAQVRLENALTALSAMPVSLPQDRPLQNAIVLISRMLDEHDPAFPRQLHGEMKASFFRQYQVAGFGPIASHRNGLLIQARHLIDALVTLPFFDHLPTAEGEVEDISEDLETMACAF